jgi:2-phospho-L-lactate/phosphoenolpyruvate guanylyltransferase
MPRFSSPLAEVGVVIPVRSFSLGKSRLAGSLGSTEHEAFVRDLADRAVDAAAPLPTAIVTSAPEVIEWARRRDLFVVADRGSLDGAANAGRSWAAERGYERVVIVHADLPDIVSLDSVAGDGAVPVVAIVACHRNDGTPVLSVPVAAPFEFSYGPGSFARHCAVARLGDLDLRVVDDATLAFDVDGPEDLAVMRARPSSPRPAAPEPAVSER